MKNVLKCFVLLIAISSCSKIELNDDSIIGIWENDSPVTSVTEKLDMEKEEWIFNDAYLGRYHAYQNGEVAFLTDFSWTVEGEIYTISYSGTDFPNDQVILVENDDATTLMKISGDNFAKKIN